MKKLTFDTDVIVPVGHVKVSRLEAGQLHQRLCQPVVLEYSVWNKIHLFHEGINSYIDYLHIILDYFSCTSLTKVKVIL